MSTINTYQITDYSNEKSSFSVTSVTATAGNLAAQQGLQADLHDAVVDLSSGLLTREQMALVVLDSPAIPGSAYAQREMKWLVRYQAVTSGKMFSVEIAAPALTSNLVPNSDEADLTSTAWVAFTAAFEAYVKSPDNGTEAVVVVDAKLVGRNI